MELIEERIGILDFDDEDDLVLTSYISKNGKEISDKKSRKIESSKGYISPETKRIGVISMEILLKVMMDIHY